ncbi:MAG: hypothetical protein ABGZ17_24555, partial [Planctomycetaceae bacterium]
MSTIESTFAIVRADLDVSNRWSTAGSGVVTSEDVPTANRRWGIVGSRFVLFTGLRYAGLCRAPSHYWTRPAGCDSYRDAGHWVEHASSVDAGGGLDAIEGESTVDDRQPAVERPMPSAESTRPLRCVLRRLAWPVLISYAVLAGSLWCPLIDSTRAPYFDLTSSVAMVVYGITQSGGKFGMPFLGVTLLMLL